APMGGQQKKPFVVTLPEEVYRIGEDYVPPKREEPAEGEPTSSAELGPLFDDEAEKKPARIFRGRLLGKEEVDLGREDDETEEDEEDDERLTLRSRKPRPAPRHPYDELPLKEAVTRLTNRAKFSTRCLWLSLPLLLAQCAGLLFAVFPDFKPDFLGNAAALAIPAAILLAIQLLLAVEVFTAAGEEWKHRRPAAAVLVLIICLLSLLSALLEGGKGAPLTTPFASMLLLLALLDRRGRLKKAAADGRMLRSIREKTVARLVTLPQSALGTADGKENRAAGETDLRLLAGDTPALHSYDGCFTRLFDRSAADRAATVLLILAVPYAALLFAINKQAAVPMTLLTVLTLAFGTMAPFALLRAAAGPEGRLANLLRRKGITLFGFEAANELSEAHELLLSDQDFFGGHAPVIAGFKLYNGHSLEESVLVTASLAHALGLPLEHVLLRMLDNRSDRLLSLTEVRHLEGGGVQAFVGGNVALLGRETFMQQHMIHIPKDDVAPAIERSGRTPLYLAMGGRLAAVFSIDYTIEPLNARMLARLTGAGAGLLLSTMDPLMTGELAEWIAGLEPGSVRTISPMQQSRLLREAADAEAKTPEGEGLSVPAVAQSNSALALAWAMLASVQLRAAARINTAVSLLAAAAGALLVSVLISSGALTTLGYPGLLLFELAWLLPVWCVTFVTTRIDK
ncbi:MAG: hypothetical protein IJC43_06875, partial [Clostridia bacterium]|nr:hypothetical protein [Clostridia bacterium]